METYIEYGVTLTDGQKTKLLSSIKNKSPLTLRLKHSQLLGSDELMSTKRQILKIQESLANGTGTDIKISKSQITHSVKHGGNLFSSLVPLGSRLLPYAVKGVSKVVPEIAKGAAWALGDIGIKKLFGKGIEIPYNIIPLLPQFKNEFTKAQIDQINRVFKTGGQLYIKSTRKQIEGGFLRTLASIGIPMAISLVSKMFGSGLQVDRGSTSNTRNVYVPSSTDSGSNPFINPMFPPPFLGKWENPIGMGVKKKSKGKGLLLGKNSPFNSIPIIGSIL